MAEVSASVVIPAHNEATVIGRCLAALLDGPLELEIVVVANGCTDETAEVARSYGVTVIETPDASKVRALNLGDATAHRFPRAYLDADITLRQGELEKLLAALDVPGVLCASPRLAYDPAALSPWVRFYYDVWTELPYVSRHVGGSGVYVISAEGRRLFGEFPDLVADDEFVRTFFSARGQRASVTTASSLIVPPRTFRSLLAVKSRVLAGNRQLSQSEHAARPSEPGPRHESSRILLRSPRLWPKVPVYAFVYGYARAAGRRRLSRGTGAVWTRDESSRQP